jgi:hypothetical protein
MRQHAKDVRVAVLAQKFPRAIAVHRGIAVGNARHVPPGSRPKGSFITIDLLKQYCA